MEPVYRGIEIAVELHWMPDLLDSEAVYASISPDITSR
jgi:hypothetical protein